MKSDLALRVSAALNGQQTCQGWWWQWWWDWWCGSRGFGGTGLSLSLDTSVGERGSVEDAGCGAGGVWQRNGVEGQGRSKDLVRRVGKILGCGM